MQDQVLWWCSCRSQRSYTSDECRAPVLKYTCEHAGLRNKCVWLKIPIYCLSVLFIILSLLIPLIPTLFSLSTWPANHFPLSHWSTAGLTEPIQLNLMDSLYEEAKQNIYSLSSLPYHQPFDLLPSLHLCIILPMGTSQSPVLYSGKFTAGLGGLSPQLQWHYSDFDQVMFWPTELSRYVFHIWFIEYAE